MLKSLVKDLNRAANPVKAGILSSFFKTGKGEYGEGDVFLGITVPEQRKIAKKYINLNLNDIQKLLDNKYHEYRLIALILLIEKYNITCQCGPGDKKLKEKIVSIYLGNVRKQNINNWDLVDMSAPKILGDYLFDKNKDILYNLAYSQSLWERRTAILATFDFIKKGKFIETLEISKILISDKEDLIHKAVGWMLREVGKKNLQTEILFLNKNAHLMSRTMLRYAIEKFKKEDRQKYLLKK